MRIIEAEPAQGASAEATERPPRRDGARSRPLPEPDRRSTLRLVLEDGGPGFCQFALNNACNARCGFCGFALDKLPRKDWHYVEREGALEAIDILYRQAVRYLVLTGGEPMLHPDLLEIVQRASGLGMKVLLVTNAGLLKPHRIRELAAGGLSSFIISIDAADADTHERNRGLPGVCDRIREANAVIDELGLHSTASVTMSRLVDYEALPDFLKSLGFKAVTFSYPLTKLAAGGLSSFIISIDAADAETHERNRGLPGVCDRIREANAVIDELGLHSTASVTMSRLVDYEALPDFLKSLGFKAVTFSYPLTKLDSNFLSFSDSDLVNYSDAELLQAFGQVKALKKRFQVVNPTASLEEMERFVRGQEQRFPCLGGFQYFYLDWHLDLWRCHNWDQPMCHIKDFDGSQRVRDGCTKCMIDCYRDSSVMQHVGVSAHDAYQSFKRGNLHEGAKALTRKGNLGSVHSVLEQLPWLLKF